MATQFVRPTVTPTITAGAYSDGDVVGGLLTFDLTGYPNAGFFLNRVLLLDKSDQKAALLLHLYNDSPTAIADNDAYARSDADLLKWIGSVAIGTYVSVSTTNATAVVVDLNDMYWTDKGKIYGYLQCNASTPTYVSTSDLVLSLYISNVR